MKKAMTTRENPEKYQNLNKPWLKRHRERAGNGDVCPRCGQTLARWKHTDEYVAENCGSYYSIWDMCENEECGTSVITRHENFVPATGVDGKCSERNPRRARYE